MTDYLALAERLEQDCVLPVPATMLEAAAALREAQQVKDDRDALQAGILEANCPDGWIGELRAEVERLKALLTEAQAVMFQLPELRALLREARERCKFPSVGGYSELGERIDAALVEDKTRTSLAGDKP